MRIRGDAQPALPGPVILLDLLLAITSGFLPLARVKNCAKSASRAYNRLTGQRLTYQ
jgi:hypothetical protein